LFEQGAAFSDHLKVHKFSCGMRGLLATTDANVGDVLATIPEACMLTDTQGRTETEMGKEVFVPENDFFVSEFDNQSLIATTLYLLEKRQDESSFVQPYCQALPTTFTSFPTNWDGDLIEELNGSHLPNLIEQRKVILQKEYWLLRELSPTFAATVVFDDFCDARLITASRGFGVVMDGEERHALLPLVDVANHHVLPDASIEFDDDKRHLKLIAGKCLVSCGV
jgi:hypothetical protein